MITINHEDYQIAQRFHAKEVHHVPGVGIDQDKFRERQLDVNEREQLRIRLGLSKDEYVLLSVGQLSKRKNQKTVIQALAAVNDEKVKYLLVGFGEKEASYRQLIRKLGSQDRVIMAGYRSDVVEILQIADCFVFPSLQEGLPVALMEAMAAGLPIICSRIRGNTDLVEDRQNGLLVEAKRTEEYTKAIYDMYTNRDAGAEYGQKSQEKVAAFSCEYVNERMSFIYGQSVDNCHSIL